MNDDVAAVEPTRVKNFARFFKNYMSVSAIVAAALPIPVTAFKLIPTYKAHTSLLSTYTSLFCFLLLGFIFYSRHQLARLMFPRFFSFYSPDVDLTVRGMRELMRFFVAILPGLLIISSLICVYLYHSVLDRSVGGFLNKPVLMSSQPLDVTSHREYASPTPTPAPTPKPKTSVDILDSVESWELPESGLLVLLYLGIFLFAESAFIIMAIKEYLQDLVKLSEIDLIEGIRH